jgi:membrane protease subunit HflC
MKNIIFSVIALVLVGFGISSFYVVSEKQQAIVIFLGEPKRTIDNPGLHFKIPMLEQVVYLEKRILSLDLPEREIRTGDEKQIVVDDFARFKIVDPLKTYTDVRNEAGASARLEKTLISNVRQVISESPLPTLMSEDRSRLMREVRDRTNKEAASYGLEVVDVRFKRVDLPEANSQAVFDRMRTERQREASEKRAEGQKRAVTIRAEADRRVAELVADAERQSQMVRGEADGKAVKIFADAYGQDKDFFEFYRTMQAYRKSLGKDDTTLVLSPDSEFFKLFIDDGGK